MIATNTFHSVVVLSNHLNTHQSSPSSSQSLTFSTPTRNLQPLIPTCTINYGRTVKVNSNSTSSTTTTSLESSDAVLGLEFIKQSCRKWQWKGEYSINYFVSSDLDLPPSSHNGPPLLLIHGFGASIPHWRRYVWIICSCFGYCFSSTHFFMVFVIHVYHLLVVYAFLH